MIIKSFEVKKKLDGNNFFLIYGENQGLKDEIVSEISKNFEKESIFKYVEKNIFQNLDDFYNNILSSSFFVKKKLIIIDNSSDKIKSEIETILEKNINDITLILLSNILDKKSKLRTFFEKEKKTICIPVYKDDNRTLFNIAIAFFRSKKINISPESINLIVERASDDRKNLKNELIKIESFIGTNKQIDIKEIVKLTNLSENHNINKIVDLSLARSKKLTLQALNENIFSTEDIIIMVRSFLTKSKRLIKLNEEYEKNQNLDQVIALSKPPIFWKDKEIVKRQMKFWSKKNLIELIKKINSLEKKVKTNSSTALNILQDFVIEQSSKTSN